MGTRGTSPLALPIFGFVAFAMVFRAYTATLLVDQNGGTPYTTIQSAIDAAVPGQDDVFVTCGRYAENVVMQDGVGLRGAGPGCTTIVSGNAGPAIAMQDIVQPTVLEGFTIRHGFSTTSVASGINVLAGSPVIRGNVIEPNGTSEGSGIAVLGDFSIVSAPVITRNIIRGNRGCCGGGGILLYGTDGAVVTSNVIEGNSAIYGGGMFVYGASTVIANNTIVGNAAELDGGGIAAFYLPITIANNVIASNRALGFGGGVYAQTVMPDFKNNDAFGNSPDNYFVQNGDPTGTNGNFSEDPRFVDTTSSSFAGYEPRSDSPLVDRGAPAWGPATDLRGVARPVDGDANGFALVDVGARENEGLTRLRAAGPSFVWDIGSHQPEKYNVYRGDLAALRQSGVYTQHPALVPGAAHFCDLSSAQLFDASTPMPEQAFFYLVAARGVVEGTIGFDGARVERPRSLPCHIVP